MEQSIKPDRKYYTKNALILLTISILVALAVAIIVKIIELADGDPEAAFIIRPLLCCLIRIQACRQQLNVPLR